MNRLEIRELKTILAMVEEGGFAGAAKKLGVTQPAISAQIARVEQIIGFPLFRRGPDGTGITAHGRELLPLIENIEREYTSLRQRASYWKRASGSEVKIQADGSSLAQAMRTRAISGNEGTGVEIWQDVEAGADWAHSLASYKADIVITGSYLLSGEVPGIRTFPLLRQKGMTCAWNPEHYGLSEAEFDMTAAVASSLILPAEEMAIGFREFLKNWCESTYGRKLDEIISAGTEGNAIELCRQGMGVLLLPGNAEMRLGLKELGLCVAYPFSLLLPDAFTFGIRHREAERSPGVIAAVKRLSENHGQAQSLAV